MAKANPVDAEIDGLIACYAVDRVRLGNTQAGITKKFSQLRFNLRRQILSVMDKNVLKIVGWSQKKGIKAYLTHDFWQALQNSRSDGDES